PMPIVVLYFDREGSLWIGGTGVLLRQSSAGIRRFDAGDSIPPVDITSILQDKDGSVWFGTVASGAIRLRDGSATTFGKHQGVSADIVRALLQDRAGRFFVGLEGAGLVVRAPDGTFKTDPALEPLRSASIRALYDDGAKGLLIGSNGGLWRLRDGALTAEPDQA